MKLDSQTIRFIQDHAGDDVARLLLGASRYPGIDIPFVAGQIAARRQIRDKLPSWYEQEGLVFPSKLATEQCSSEATAGYKQRLVGEKDIVCDLTGGLGVDSYYLSRKAKTVIYVERNEEYAGMARHNMHELGAGNIEVIQGDSTTLLPTLPDPDLFYLDPARRGEGNKRLFALPDCDPDLLLLLPALFQKAPKVIAKISPMADIRQTLLLLPQATGIHVLSVKNECKELLFVLEREVNPAPPVIDCVDFTAESIEKSFSFTLEEEQKTVPQIAHRLMDYLYEPNASVMKAGAFKTIATRFGVSKLAINSHLYTSDDLITTFPGRIFEVKSVTPFHKKNAKTLSARFPKANITVRNFPLTVDELRKRTGIKEGGEVYLFATSLADGSRIIVECRRKNPHQQ